MQRLKRQEKIAKLSKEMAMQGEVDDEQLKELENISLYIRKFLHFGTEVKKSAPVQRAQLSVMTIRKCKNLLRIRHHQGHHPL